MKVEHVHVEGFGKFENFSFSLKDGLNIIYGGNAAGKTTLANFIRYCLTGDLPEVENYKPWYANKFGGHLETDEGTIAFGYGVIDPEVFIFTSFLPENVDQSLDGSKNISSMVVESYKNLPEAKKMEKVLNENFAGLLEKEKSLESEILHLKEILKGWRKRREETLSWFIKKKELQDEFSEKKKKLDEARNKFNEEKSEKLKAINSEIERTEEEISRVRKELEKIGQLPPGEKLREVHDFFQKVEYLKKRISQLEKEVEELEKKSLETKGELQSILEDFSANSLEELKLKVENLRLQISVFESEHKSKVNEIVKRLREPLEKVESRLNNITEEMEKVGDGMKRIDRLSSVVKIFVSALLSFSAISVVFSFLISNILFVYLSIASAIGAAISLWGYFKVKSKLSDLETKFVSLSSQKRELVKEKNQMLNRMRDSIGVESLSELEIVLKDRVASNVFKMAPFLKKYGSDPTKALENVEIQIRELLILKDSVESSLLEKRKSLEELREYLKNQESELSERLDNLGVKTSKELLENLEKLEQKLKLEKLEENLQKNLNRLLTQKKEIESMKSNVEIEELEKELKRIEEELESLTIPSLEDPFDFIESLYRKEAELELMERAIANIPLFKEKVRKKYEDFLNSYANELAIELGSVYKKFFGEPIMFKVSPFLEISVSVPNEKPAKKILNTSALKILSFYVKNFLARVLMVEIPLVIDNTFVDLDDEKVDLLLEELENLASSRQIIFFTSDKRFLKEEPLLRL
ncbi:ATP-binding protein [Thermotoga sp. KOL6]|uniref:ATP-binding protein n=1 Tax=Thermotoga sp. KOL6 TaxID=126741 RepID=UPI000C764C15|nr:AAA family ATPase [Thermotoga sp. KOL6]PLV59256.1 hypothetical protein AS005_05815 [Thermotoga sp. KOL6]